MSNRLSSSKFQSRWIRAIAAAVLAVGFQQFSAATDTQTVQVLDPATYHLGRAENPEWPEFAGRSVHGPELELRLSRKPNDSEQTLMLFQDDVKQDWTVELNGTRLGLLEAVEAPLHRFFSVPAGTWLEGENKLRIYSGGRTDNIVVGNVRLLSSSFEQLASKSLVRVSVTDSSTGAPLPCRVSVVDANGAFVPVQPAPGQKLAVRTGVIYTANGEAQFGMLPGEYVFYASRGFEYGVAERRVTVLSGSRTAVSLSIEREVNTTGYAAVDPHVHTFTLSRHGDATLEERVITVAGEGVEAPVATDHNILATYEEAARQMAVRSFFTPMIGTEVTTRRGHFNVFPISEGAPLPNHQLTNWVDLFRSIRATPGAQVVVLNHPRDIHYGFRPFGPENFNSASGSNRHGEPVGYDAIELINSSAQQTDFMVVYKDWFALLNRGHQVTGVGSSDSHDVSRYIVGQGRTYVRCDDTEPGALDVDEICQSLVKGRALVSLGLLTTLTVDDENEPGDLATDLKEEIEVTVEVFGPSWVTANHLALYANGKKIKERTLQGIPPNRDGRKATASWKLPRPRHDVYLVAIATGPGVTEPYWKIPRPYQPQPGDWTPRVIGSTNPLRVDSDGDGLFSSPHDYALRVWKESAGDLALFVKGLGEYDEAVAVQGASIAHNANIDLTGANLQTALASGSAAVKAGFEQYRRSLEH